MTTQPDALPRRPIGSSALRFTTAGRRSRRIMLDGRVLQTASSDGSAYVHVEFGPARRSQVPILGPEQRPMHLADLPAGIARWALRYRRGWLRLPDDGLLVDSVTVTTDALVERPSAPRPWQPWYETMLGARDSYYERAGRLEWVWGWPSTGDADIWGRRLLVTGHVPGTHRVRHRIDLGPGLARSVAGVGRYLWVSIERRLSPPLHYASELLRIDGTTGDVHTAIGTDSVAIDALGWPLVTRPAHARTHAQRERERVAGVVLAGGGHRWLGGPPDGVFDPSVDLVDDWPDTAVRVRFRHERWPGLLLQRRLPVFDELGRPVPVDLDMVGWRLAEWLDGGLAPPARDAIDRLLEL